MMNMRMGMGRRRTVAAPVDPVPPGEDDFMQIKKTITLADLNALGAETAGNIDFDEALPAGAILVALVVRKRQEAELSSSGGSPSDMRFNVVAPGESGSLLSTLTGSPGEIRGLHQSGELRGQGPIGPNVGASRAKAEYPLESPTTYSVRVQVQGSGVNLGNLDGPAGDLYEATLVYSPA